MQFRNIRRTLATVLVAAAMFGMGPAPAAVAANPTKATLTLTFSATVEVQSSGAEYLHIVAYAKFVGGVANNSTLALQVDGVEHATDAETGVPTAHTIYGAPISVRFDEENVIHFRALLDRQSTLGVAINAEATGLAPTVFAAHCTGTAARVEGGRLAVVQSC